MTSFDWRSRILAILAGQTPDRIPAIFRMSRWHKPRVHAGTLPPEVAGMSLPQIEDYLGLARSARYAKIYRIEFRSPVECVVSRQGDDVITEYRTPRGTLRRVARFNPGDEVAGIDPSIVGFPIKTADGSVRSSEPGTVPRAASVHEGQSRSMGAVQVAPWSALRMT